VLEYVPSHESGTIDWYSMEPVNLAIAILTNTSSAYMFIVALYWWWRLWTGSDTDFRGWFLGTAAVMFGLFLWSLTNIVQMVWFNVDLPLTTLAGRVAILVGILIKIWKTAYARTTLTGVRLK